MSYVYIQPLKEQIEAAEAEHQKLGDALNRLINYCR